MFLLKITVGDFENGVELGTSLAGMTMETD